MTNMVIRGIIHLNIEFVHHVWTKCLYKVRVPSDPVVLESIPFDIIYGERILHISNMGDNSSAVFQEAFKTMVRHNSNCDFLISEAE